MDSVGNPNKELILNDVVKEGDIVLKFNIKIFSNVLDVNYIDKLQKLIIDNVKNLIIYKIREHNMKNLTVENLIVNIFRNEKGNPEYIFSLLVPQNDKFLKDAIIATERITINDNDDMDTVYNTVSENLPKLCSEIIKKISSPDPQNPSQHLNQNNPYIKPTLITLGSIAGIIIMLGIYKYVKKRKHNKEDKQYV